jgi:magnesium transporter
VNATPLEKIQDDVVDVMSAEPETAARHMVTRIPTALQGTTVGAVLAELAGSAFDSVSCVYVVDGGGTLVGRVGLPRLLATGMQIPMSDIMRQVTPVVTPEEDQEQVTAVAIEHGVPEVAVVDPSGQLLGVVPSQALLRIQRREHSEDIGRLAGIVDHDDRARSALEDPPWPRALNRLPWLLIGLVGSAAATWLVASFEATLQSRLALAFFVPAIVYLAGAIGTQSIAAAVRGLSFTNVPVGRLMLGEFITGIFIGLLLAAISGGLIWAILGDLQLALTVALALIAAGGLSTTTGLILPWLLSCLGKDPAYGSGPVATIIQDLLSLLAYFGIASFILL